MTFRIWWQHWSVLGNQDRFGTLWQSLKTSGGDYLRVAVRTRAAVKMEIWLWAFLPTTNTSLPSLRAIFAVSYWNFFLSFFLNSGQGLLTPRLLLLSKGCLFYSAIVCGTWVSIFSALDWREDDICLHVGQYFVRFNKLLSFTPNFIIKLSL